MTNNFLHTFHSGSSNSQPKSIFVTFCTGWLNMLEMLTYSKLPPLLQCIVPFLLIFLSSLHVLSVHIRAALRRCKEEREVQEGAIHWRKGASKEYTSPSAHVANANCLESYYKRLLDWRRIKFKVVISSVYLLDLFLGTFRTWQTLHLITTIYSLHRPKKSRLELCAC